jgi:hypothetical protein
VLGFSCAAGVGDNDDNNGGENGVENQPVLKPWGGECSFLVIYTLMLRTSLSCAPDRVYAPELSVRHVIANDSFLIHERSQVLNP